MGNRCVDDHHHRKTGRSKFRFHDVTQSNCHKLLIAINFTVPRQHGQISSKTDMEVAPKHSSSLLGFAIERVHGDAETEAGPSIYYKTCSRWNPSKSQSKAEGMQVCSFVPHCC